MTTVATIAAPASPAPRTADGGSDASQDAPAVRDPNLRNVLAEELANERRAELIREEGAIRDMLMAFLKDEDAYLKKWIELI